MYLTMALYLCIQAHAAAQTEQKLGLINTQDIEERAQMLMSDEEWLASHNRFDQQVWDEPLDFQERIEIGYEPNAKVLDRLVGFYLSMREVVA